MVPYIIFVAAAVVGKLLLIALEHRRNKAIVLNRMDHIDEF